MAAVLQEDKVVTNETTRKLHWHIMLRFCLLTILNHMDRANLVWRLLSSFYTALALLSAVDPPLHALPHM